MQHSEQTLFSTAVQQCCLSFLKGSRLWLMTNTDGSLCEMLACQLLTSTVERFFSFCLRHVGFLPCLLGIQGHSQIDEYVQILSYDVLYGPSCCLRADSDSCCYLQDIECRRSNKRLLLIFPIIALKCLFCLNVMFSLTVDVKWLWEGRIFLEGSFNSFNEAPD